MQRLEVSGSQYYVEVRVQLHAPAALLMGRASEFPLKKVRFCTEFTIYSSCLYPPSISPNVCMYLDKM